MRVLCDATKRRRGPARAWPTRLLAERSERRSGPRRGAEEAALPSEAEPVERSVLNGGVLVPLRLEEAREDVVHRGTARTCQGACLVRGSDLYAVGLSFGVCRGPGAGAPAPAHAYRPLLYCIH